MNQRIGLYGGSFDPIHFGHLISARCIAEQIGLDRVILIPSARPPHKQGQAITDPKHRLAMTRLAVEGDPLFEVSEVELHRAGPSYTFDTVQQFQSVLGASADLFWIIGADSLPELPSWYRIGDLVQRVSIITARRPGFPSPDIAPLAAVVGEAYAQRLLTQCCVTPEIDISSTAIRSRAVLERPIRYLVPEGVASYILNEGLYRRDSAR